MRLWHGAVGCAGSIGAVAIGGAALGAADAVSAGILPAAAGWDVAALGFVAISLGIIALVELGAAVLPDRSERRRTRRRVRELAMRRDLERAARAARFLAPD